MTKILALSLSLSVAHTALASEPVQKNGAVNTKESKLQWTGYKVTGKHFGTVQLRSANLQFSGSSLTGGSFEIDMSTITTEDLSGEYATKLVNHLKSDDFFGVAQHPTAKFAITKVIPQGSGLYKIEGNLTIKGTTKPIRFNATSKENAGKQHFNAQIKVDRSDFNVRYGSGSFFENLGDKTIYDEFDLSISLVTE